MSRDDYKRALDAAVREYERLIAEQATVEARITQLKQSIATLTRLCGYEPTVQLGLTEACRMVLRNADQAMTALDVRDRLTTIGLDMGRYSNALASIHTVLKRMHEAGELTEQDRDEDPHAKAAYAYGPRVLVSRAGKRRVLRKDPVGEGLCPPKDRKK